MDLFSTADPRDSHRPLAERMRPAGIDQVVGQDHLLAPGRFLRQLLEQDRIPSLIFWGPPGSGKTTLARVIAAHTRSRFVSFSAVTGSVAQVREIMEEARGLARTQGQHTILFVDEIHRFNKAQQDAFLPFVEDGTITLIGATTENPSFEVVAPLLSRSRVVRLKSLEAEHLASIVDRAMADTEQGLGGLGLTLEDDARSLLAQSAGGDARRVLSLLEVTAELAGSMGVTRIGVELAAEAVQEKVLTHDKGGDDHYNVVSAFIKSMRGSDPDAALYYMLRMLDAGENPRFIFRRMVIFAAEDVGNADPWALMVANNAFQAFELVGLPEGEIPMAQAATYLACAPKSNRSYLALDAARQDVKKHGSLEVPAKLRNAPTRLMKEMGYGRQYVYPHDTKDAYSPEHYLPSALAGRCYYQPSQRGYEKTIASRLEQWRQLRDKSSPKDDPEV